MPSLAALTVIGIAALLGTPAHAQDYPTRPIRMIVPWPPAGGTDVIARLVAPRLGESLGQQVVVDNRGGAATIIGTDLLAKSAPDGYTLGFATSNLVVNPALYAKLPFDARRDLAPVSMVARGLYSLVVHPSLPAKSVGELVALVKAAPDRYLASLAGSGTPPHLGLAQFNTHTGASVRGVNYKGAGPASAALLGGETQIMFASYPTVAPLVQAGRLRLLAVTGARRSASLPDVPTVIEGGLAGFVVEEWYAVMAPARTPPARIRQISDTLGRVLAQGDLRERLLGLGAEVAAAGPADLGRFLDDELRRWSRVIREAGIKADS